MKSLVFALALLLSWRKIATSTLPPTVGIPPCLIPPFQNLVYQYEAAIKGRPGIRTGCYVQGDPNGSPIPVNQIFPAKTTKPLQYYVIDASGKKAFLPENGTVVLQLQKDKQNTSGNAPDQIFPFDQICFPILCYSSVEMYVRSCFDESQCGSCGGSEIPHEHGGHSTPSLSPTIDNLDNWLYCKTGYTGDDYQLAPIISPATSFGDLQNLTRIPGFTTIAGPHIFLQLLNAGPSGTITSGCDLVFPLKAPYNTYMRRFWYQVKAKRLTISEGQTVVAERIIESNCQALVPEYGERACTERKWLETFKFEDFCFPEECYIGRKYNCTGKAGAPKRESKNYELSWKPEAAERSDLLYLNLVWR